MFERGLAYQKSARVNWCPELPDGPRQRAGRGRPLLALRLEVIIEEIAGWYFKITAYAEELARVV